MPQLKAEKYSAESIANRVARYLATHRNVPMKCTLPAEPYVGECKNFANDKELDDQIVSLMNQFSNIIDDKWCAFQEWDTDEYGESGGEQFVAKSGPIIVKVVRVDHELRGPIIQIITCFQISK